MTLQDEMDRIVYPPSHTYKLKGLIPGTLLAKRMEVIKKEFPHFFKIGTLLDVGCNKGFFSLYHDGTVTGIDPSSECIDLCRKLCPSGSFHLTTFGEFDTDDKFDKIFIGNGHHYPFIEARGWGWVDALGKLSNGLVLLEGPTGMEGIDAQRCIPSDIVEEFTQEKLLEAFNSRFILCKIVPSSLIDRFFLLFQRRTPGETYSYYLRRLYKLASAYIRSTDTVMEICTRHDRGILGEEILPHSKYIMVDKNLSRPGLSLDAIRDELPHSDVTISTAVFHHTAPKDIETLFNNIARSTQRTIIISGPADDLGIDLYGDHLYHLNRGELRKIGEHAGWKMVFNRRIGLDRGEEYEFFLVFTRGSEL